MTRIGPLHFGHWRGSASYTSRISPAHAALARCAYPLKTSVMPLEFVAGAVTFAARAPQLRLGVVLSALFLGEYPQWYHFSGIALILFGVALSSGKVKIAGISAKERAQ